MMKTQIHDSWQPILQKELNKPYIQTLFNFLENERLQHTVFPAESKLFEALNKTPFEEIKVVILGQDPYHQVGQANGLAFSVGKGILTPPSLRNIYKELEQDINDFYAPNHGDLSSWAKQGILLLNTTLTVRKSEPGSHQKKGWEELTDTIIREISDQKSGVIFLLWGKFAQEKTRLINQEKHYILHSTHPSPLSAYRGFLGCKHFSKTNEILEKQNTNPIDWKLH